MNSGQSGAHPPHFANANVLTLSVDEIAVPERIGFLHEDKAAALGRLMRADGQRDPVKVAPNKGAKPWKLVTGLHRYHGAKIEGIELTAIEVNGDADYLRDIEASENLHRRKLEPLERAKFVAALVDVAQRRIAAEHGGISQQKLAIKARWEKVKLGEARFDEAMEEEVGDTCAKIAHVYGWEESVAEAIGLGRRSIHNDLLLHRTLIAPFPQHAAALAAHPVVGSNASQLMKLAKVKDDGLREQAVEALLRCPGMDAGWAREEVGVDTPKGATTPFQKHCDAITGNWGRLTLPQQRAFVPQLAKMLTPEMKRELRDQLTKELGE